MPGRGHRGDTSENKVDKKPCSRGAAGFVGEMDNGHEKKIISSGKSTKMEIKQGVVMKCDFRGP